jgi:very-short-patch-repair endonuclease
MTKTENDFLKILKSILHERYQIFPQVHLTALLDEKMVKGQNWKAAFRHINGKSVDFVVCDIEYARPMTAIELDDPSHDTEERRSRDLEVECIFDKANIPLLRFRNHKNMSREAIANLIGEAIRSSS